MIEAWAAFGLWSGVQRSAAVYATISALHVFGIAMLVGPVVVVDLRLLGWCRALDGAALLVLRRTAGWGLLLAVATGLVLVSAKPADYFAHRVFLAKLMVVFVGAVHALAIECAMRRQGAVPLLDHPRAALFGAVSLAIWLTALGLGRWIAFS